MDEENKKSQSFLHEAGNKLKEADKDRAKKSQTRKKLIKILKYAPILLWGIIIIIAGFFIISVIIDFLDEETAIASKEADSKTIDYSITATDESSPNRIIVDINNVTEDGAYILTYEFKDEDGNVYPEDEALENIKNDLSEKNKELDLSSFSDSELKIIGALMYNGLKVENYNEEELKAIVIFIKADIAGKNFDLRKKDEIGKEVTLEDISQNDYVYGTLQAQRVKIDEDESGNLKYADPEILEYLKYGDEETEGTFAYMVKQKDSEVLDKFSINEEGELVVARWSSATTTYTYLDENKNPLSQDQIELIPEDLVGESKTETSITKAERKYKTYVTKYALSYGVLSDLLITTNNVDFCLDLAQLACNSKIVININEELTSSHTTRTVDYKQTTVLYDYVKYEISGTKNNETTIWQQISSGEGNPANESSLTAVGWNSGMEPTSVTGNSSGGTTTYEWTNEGTNYRLQHISASSHDIWTLYKQDEITAQTSLTPKENLWDSAEDGELIKNAEEETLGEECTAIENFNFTVKTEINSIRNNYVFEIGIVDTWSMKYNYNKQYNAPIESPGVNDIDNETIGEYSEITQVLKTDDDTQIESDTYVQAFKQNIIEDYKAETGADNAVCDFSELTVYQRVKMDSHEISHTDTMTYKFGEEIADTTEVSMKNVEFINNEPSFTAKDLNGNPELGFLYFYDKYLTAGVDLYLQNDAEQKLFELLESDPETSSASNIIKYLLYVYDGIDRGVTELDLSIYKPQEMKSATLASAVLLKQYIRSWEHSSPPPTNADGTCYIIEDDGAGHPTVGYGVDIFNSGYSYLFEQNGYPTEIGGEVPIEFVDGIEDMIIEDYKQQIEAAVSGLDLTGYQINALVSRAYNCGVAGAVDTERGDPARDFVDSYLAYWNQEEDDQFKEKNNNADFSHELYEQYMSKPVTSDGTFMQGLQNRRESEWTLFQTGYYDTLELWHMSAESLLVAASEVHDAQMSWSYALTGLPSNDIEASLNNPNQVTCCATYVASVIYVAGYVTEEEMNSFENYNYVPTLYEDLKNLGWEEIYSYDELEPGDIVVTQNDGTFAHIQIYAGDDTWYNAGSTEAIQSPAPQDQGDWARTYFQIALRPSN